MATTEIEVTFDAAAESFSYSPDPAPLAESDPEARLTLVTVGGASPATFARSDAVTWKNLEKPDRLTMNLVGPTLLTVQGFPRDSPERYEYAVTIDYEGSSFTSAGYPSMGPTGTGGD